VQVDSIRYHAQAQRADLDGAYGHKNEKETPMSMTRKCIALVGMSLVAGTVSTAAFAISKRAGTVVRSDVVQLLRAMDNDMSGTVSKDEFKTSWR
jgi:hypothetical protein